MISNCRTCGNYTIVPGAETAAVLGMIRRLRSHVDLSNKPMDQLRILKQAHLELTLLLLRMDADPDAFPEAARPKVTSLTVVK